MTMNQPNLSDFHPVLVPKFAPGQRVKLAHNLCVEGVHGYEYLYRDEIVSIVEFTEWGVIRYRIAIQGSPLFHWVTEDCLTEVTG